MKLFEAIKVLYTERFLVPVQLVEDEQRLEVEWHQFLDAEYIIKNVETYRHFTGEEGHAVALAAIDLFDLGTYAGRYLLHEILAHLADGVPGSLKWLFGY